MGRAALLQVMRELVRRNRVAEGLLYMQVTRGVAERDFSYAPDLSGNGRYVAFASAATDLVRGDTNGQLDVFVHDLQTGTTELVSAGGDGG